MMPSNPTAPVQFFKYEPSGGRGQMCVAFREPPPDYVVRALCNLCNSGGYDLQGNGRLFRFWTHSSQVPDIKIDIAKAVLHRVGFERHDEAFKYREDADEVFGYDAPECED